jgi:hypothetical protein
LHGLPATRCTPAAAEQVGPPDLAHLNPLADKKDRAQPVRTLDLDRPQEGVLEAAQELVQSVTGLLLADPVDEEDRRRRMEADLDPDVGHKSHLGTSSGPSGVSSDPGSGHPTSSPAEGT